MLRWSFLCILLATFPKSESNSRPFIFSPNGVPCTPLENLNAYANSAQDDETNMIRFIPEEGFEEEWTLQTKKETEKRKRTFKTILKLVMSESCHMNSGLVNPGFSRSGFGNTLHSMVLPALYAMRFGECIRADETFLYGHLDKYFRRWNTGPGFEWEPSDDEIRDLPADLFDQPVCELAGEYEEESKDQYSCIVADNENIWDRTWEALGPAMLPKSFENEHFFYHVSTIMSEFYAPVDQIKREIVKRKEAMNWPDNAPVLGLHVRLGDSCVDKGHQQRSILCEPLSTYIPSVEELTKRYGIGHVYLSTDSNQAVLDAENYPQYTWLVEKKDRFNEGYDDRIENLIDSGKVSGLEEGLEAYIDMLLLAETHALVGRFSSHFARSALEISSGSRECVMPYVSLDFDWYFGVSTPPKNAKYNRRWLDQNTV